MSTSIRYFLFALLLTFVSCKRGSDQPDASGVFEADEVLVSSEVTGKIISFTANEGTLLTLGQTAAIVDTTALVLQKEQVEASIHALQEKTSNLSPFIEVLQQQYDVQAAQLKSLQREQKRLQNLVAEDAATGKQLDDMNTQVDVLKEQMKLTQRQIEQQRTVVGTQNRGVLSEKAPLEKRVEMVQDQLHRAQVQNPVAGTVLTKYVNQGELIMAGKALYKIANLDELDLRAYVSSNQLAKLRLNQSVQVRVDDGNDQYKMYTGKLTWISGKAEFTPKTIQTKEERANLVYAIKIRVKNDGYLKLGMYGEVIGIE